MRLAICALAALACVTPYGPRGDMGGYEDFEVPGAPGLHFVGFYGNGFTERSDVVVYWRRRAAEICAKYGGQFQTVKFALQTREDQYENRGVTLPTRCTSSLGTTTCTGGNTVGGGVDTIRKPSVEGYIRCGAKAQPQG